MGRSDGERHELAARPLGARGGAQSPAARRRACSPVLAPVPAWPGPGQPAPGALLPGRGDDGLARMAPVGDGGGPAPDPWCTAALLRQALLDDGPCAGDRGHRRRDGRLGRGDRVRPAGRGAGRAGSGRRELRRGHADGGAPRRAGEHRAAGRRPASSLRRARREGDPGGLRPAAGVVLAAPGSAPRAAGAEGVRVGRCGGVSGTVVRAATGHREEQASRSRVARGLGDPVAHGLPLRPVRRRRGPHADARRYRLGQELHTELPPGRSSQVRPARPDPGSGRLLPLADPLPRGPLPGALAGRGGAHAPAAAVRAPGGHADVPVPDGLGAPATEARRLGSERRGYERDPGPDRGSVCVRAGAADAERLGKLASVRDVAGLEPLDRRRRLGRLLR